MSIYAIRKNSYAGVYTNKDIYEDIRKIEAHCSCRIFEDSEVDAALKWAGVNKVDKITRKSLDEKLDKVLTVENNITEKKVDLDSNAEIVEEETTKDECGKKLVSDVVCLSVDVERHKVKNPSICIENIEQYRKNHTWLIMRTESFGDIYILNNFICYEKYWNKDYGFTVEDRIYGGLIEYRPRTEIEVDRSLIVINDSYMVKDGYESSSENLIKIEDTLIIRDIDVKGFILKKDFGCKWFVDGELEEFTSESDCINSVLNWYKRYIGKEK